MSNQVSKSRENFLLFSQYCSKEGKDNRVSEEASETFCLFLGEQGAGKSSLIAQFLGKKGEHGYDNSIGD